MSNFNIVNDNVNYVNNDNNNNVKLCQTINQTVSRLYGAQNDCGLVFFFINAV